MFKWNENEGTGLGRETAGREKIENVGCIERKIKHNNVGSQIHGK